MRWVICSSYFFLVVFLPVFLLAGCGSSVTGHFKKFQGVTGFSSLLTTSL